MAKGRFLPENTCLIKEVFKPVRRKTCLLEYSLQDTLFYIPLAMVRNNNPSAVRVPENVMATGNVVNFKTGLP